MALRLAQPLGHRPSLCDKPRVIFVQLNNFVLLDDCDLIRLAQFGLQLLDLVLMPTRLLFALFATGAAEMLECLARMLQLLLK